MALNKNKPTPEQIDQFVEFAQKAESKIPLPIPLYKSVPSALAQGAMGAYAGLAKMAGSQATFGDEPRAVISPFDTESQQVARKQLQEAETLGSDIESKAEEYFPIGDSFIPKAVRRGSRAFLDNVYFGLSGALRSVAGAGLAEGAKEMGAPGWMQTSIELGAQIAPDLKNIVTARNAQERALVDWARQNGFAEEEIPMLLNQRGLVKDALQEISVKGGRVAERFSKTKQALGRMWDAMKTRPDAQTPVSANARRQLVSSVSQKMATLPAEQVKLVEVDWKNFLSSKQTPADIIEFWQKLNYPIKKGETALGIFKEDLSTAISSISPELGIDFNIANELHGNYYKLAKRLSPDIASTFFKHGQAMAVMGGIVTGNLPLLYSTLGIATGRNLAAEMVTNPRLMNLTAKLISGLNQRSPAIAKKVLDQMLIEIGKTNPEAVLEMSDIDFDEYFKSLPKSNKKNNNME